MTDVVWTPSQEAMRTSRMARFMNATGSTDWPSLWSWSISRPDEFWSALWDFADVIGTQGDVALVGDDMLGARWFPDASLNYAENLLRRRDAGTALVARSESRPDQMISFAELASYVGSAQHALRRLGVGVGDRVAAIVPNGVEAIVAMLATSSLGAIWSSCSPDFGPMGVIDRFGQIEPAVLLAADGYRYNGRDFPIESTVLATVDAIPDLRAVVTIDHLGTGLHVPGAIPWSALTAEPDEPEFIRLPFDHPLFIMYSSGTTGAPKSIVHGAGGTLLKHLSEHMLHSDIGPESTVFWFTTCGWMMWNWLAGALGSGAGLVAYDGSPGHPSLAVLWELAEETGITHFGTSPKFLAANAKTGVVPRELADLSAMRWLGSTGAPLNPEQFDWVYENVSDTAQLASVSGGTDIIGCFVLGNPLLPVRRGEIQGPALGMGVDAFDEFGEPIRGGPGELVCTVPFPSMPVRFWGDADGSMYRGAYFERFPGIWTHGDYVEVRPEGGFVIHGRSDTTLNPGGVRIGTAEIYRAIEPMPEVIDAIVVGHQGADDVEVVLCIQLAAGHELGDELQARIRKRIREQTSPRHVPRHVFAVKEIPYTISGKKVEKAVRLALAGDPVPNRDAMANPDAIDHFVGLLAE